jgi:hypothetical protein
MAKPTTVRIASAQVYDTRAVEITVDDAAAICTTPTGKAPMRVIAVDLRYSLIDGTLIQLQVRGYRDGDLGAITRRFEVWRAPLPDHTPNWLRNLVNRYRPDIKTLATA